MIESVSNFVGQNTKTTFYMKRLMTLLAAAFMVLAVNAQELANFQRVNVVSPEVKDGQVTFRLKADYATDVQLYGSWMPGYGDRIQLKRGQNYIWEVTIPAPTPAFNEKALDNTNSNKIDCKI